jgi:hypothetical protein
MLELQILCETDNLENIKFSYWIKGSRRLETSVKDISNVSGSEIPKLFEEIIRHHEVSLSLRVLNE